MRHFDAKAISIALVSASSLGLPASLHAADVRLRPIAGNNGLAPQIINGRPAREADWPVTVISDSLFQKCTATIVGPRVLLTAAHCFSPGDNVSINITNREVELICHSHPAYIDPRPPKWPFHCDQYAQPEDLVSCTADIAICLRKDNDSFPATVGKFERVKSAPPGPLPNQLIQLLGFGCLMAHGPMSKDLQIGSPAVVWTSTPGASSNPHNTFHEFVKTSGSGATCEGDSGGAAYSGIDPKTREIIGIAARGNLSIESYLVNVLDPPISNWLKTFPSAVICGLHSNAKNCTF